MNLQQLRYFMVVAKLENISRAAQVCLIPQPAMSRTISALEREVGTQFFDRSNNGLKLNENGKAFYEAVSQSLNGLDIAIERLKDDGGIIKGEIKLLILQSRDLMINLIYEFSKAYPAVTFSISHKPTKYNDEFDFIFASENFSSSLKTKKKLFSEKIILAVNFAHPLSQKKEVTFNDLINESFIAMPDNSELSSIVNRACSALGFTQKNRIICDDPFYIRKYVSLNLGIAFAPALSWSNLWEKNISFLNLSSPQLKRTTHIYCDATSNLSRHKKIFYNFMLAFFRDN